MMVQIFRSSKPTYWYSKRIGESFLVEDFYDEVCRKYKWKVIPNNGRCIDREDTEEQKPKFKRMLRLVN